MWIELTLENGKKITFNKNLISSFGAHKATGGCEIAIAGDVYTVKEPYSTVKVLTA